MVRAPISPPNPSLTIRLFIIQGVASVIVTFIAFFTLPDSPLKTRWLTEEERQLAHSRIYADTTGRRSEKTTVWTGLREAVTDWRVWVFCLMDNLHLSANSFKNFLPTVIETLGYNDTITLVLTSPPYILSAFISVAVSWSSGRYNERTWHITASKSVAIAGFIIGTATSGFGVRYFGIMLFVGATCKSPLNVEDQADNVDGVNNIILGWTASTLGQTDEKKAVAIAMANTFGNLSFVYTPYLWPDTDAPDFTKAFSASAAFSAGVVICAWIMRFSLQRKNKQLKGDASVTNLYVY